MFMLKRVGGIQPQQSPMNICHTAVFQNKNSVIKMPKIIIEFNDFHSN